MKPTERVALSLLALVLIASMILSAFRAGARTSAVAAARGSRRD